MTEPKPCVFIHTNHKQILGAIVGVHSIRRGSQNNDRFDVRTIEHADHPFLRAREGQSFNRDGIARQWRNEDLQSFTPLRFMPPELMGYRGRAVVIDPDVFAVGDVWNLLDRDMRGKAILCRPRNRKSRSVEGNMASSVMLLDCAQLPHWQVEKQFNSMFEGQLDYKDWITLRNEPRSSIGLFESGWNDLDRLNTTTQMLHTTKRWTQPWKTGLPIDFTPADKFRRFPPLGWILRARRRLLGDHSLLGHYRQHPDPRQEGLFFALLKECLEDGQVDEAFVREQISRKHVREDAFEVVERVKSPEDYLSGLPEAAAA
ncbi:MAG: hypothetical protein GY910_02745 [bacterium]|nr:hypothetical protein [Deltaproteobacteria bacterium]MCP4903872.1 hypothetical protein [bacterium]